MVLYNKYFIFNASKRKISYFLVLFFNLSVFYAQQVPHYTQYLYNMQVINPAYVGSKSDLSFSLLSRDQWVGVEGAPRTSTFSASARSNSGIALGFTVVKDEIGLTESTNTNIDASYTIITSQYGRLALGLKAGLTFFDSNLRMGITPDNDINPNINGQSPNIGFGLYYYTQKFFAGFSMPYLLKSSIFRDSNSQNVDGLNENLNYFLNTGIIFSISENIMFKPSTHIKYATNSSISVDLNANFLYNDKIETGISYRYENSLSFLFAVIVKQKLRIGYAYDYRLDNFGNNLNSHEIILKVNLNLNRGSRWLQHNKCYF